MTTRAPLFVRRCKLPRSMVRRAFTLTEVVVAMLLMTAVLSATWSLLNTFRDRFERSQARAERSQLIRAVQQSLENDLASGLVLRGRRPEAGRARTTGPSTATGRRETTRDNLRSPSDNGQGTTNADFADAPAANASRGMESPDMEGAIASGQGGEGNASESGEDSPVQREEDMAGMDDPSRDARQVSMAFQAETDQVSQGEWLANEVRFLGTGSALVCDILTPAEDQAPPAWNAESPDAPLTATLLEGDAGLSGGRDFRSGPREEFADIPEHSRRIVYLFTDPEAAMRTGRAPGLIRCELTNRHLAMIRTLAPDRADLYALVQPLTGVQQVLKGAPGDDGPGGMPAPSMGGMEGISFAQAPAPAGLPSSGSMDLVIEPPKIDYIPEVKAFRLRYHDGQGWRERWDSRDEQELPVAVEMRFLFEFPRPLADGNGRGDASGDAANPDGTATESWSAEMGQAWLAGGALEANPDDRMRSAQTVPIEDHRYVILLSSPPQLRQSSGTPGLGPSDERAQDPPSQDGSRAEGGLSDGGFPGTGGAQDEVPDEVSP